MTDSITIPLIIGGRDITLPSDDRKYPIPPHGGTQRYTFQGATSAFAIEAVDAAAAAFPSWSQTTPAKRREMLIDVARLLRNKSDEALALVQEEIHCSQLWAEINVEDAVGLIEEAAALVTDAMAGTIPATRGNSYGLVTKEPLGVILGIAPWNAPLILGFRAVVPALATGNAVILKGSELSPRTHHFIASLFREAGFPPGVVNFVLHGPDDAAEIYDTIINRPEVRKCNFTGSTAVGRIIASKAALALKPVLLELGGKNFSIIMDDADLDSAASHVVEAAFLNNGQICMSTDIVYVVKPAAELLVSKILGLLKSEDRPHKVISAASKLRLTRLVDDARSKGAVIHQAGNTLSSDVLSYPATVIENLDDSMDFYHVEAFGPVVGVMVVESEHEALRMARESPYGLSAAIFSQDHFRALGLSREIRAGAVHINSSTIHDEPTLPHGGVGNSGWGRFGSRWGLDEFLQTKVVVLNK
ncbi:related to NAD-dependent aldehyde dehydrogenases [Cephalotrichum gorgonifer]|uniref:Related to NAD-dependent aldehyde dehydrogenases n=1 Tax=Cephalotrichum gorgonifer TaxID=2041049 RepID=A0AAE8SZI3_9PEZI|nr:related to NAD-dependent aldehyde dehydrogenases [Cephalotrichum gorgonifer]